MQITQLKKVLEDMLTDIKEEFVEEPCYTYLVEPFIDIDNLAKDVSSIMYTSDSELDYEIQSWIEDKKGETYELWSLLTDKYLINDTLSIVNYGKSLELDSSINNLSFRRAVNEYCVNWFDGAHYAWLDGVLSMKNLDKLWEE